MKMKLVGVGQVSVKCKCCSIILRLAIFLENLKQLKINLHDQNMTFCHQINMPKMTVKWMMKKMLVLLLACLSLEVQVGILTRKLWRQVFK